MYTRYCMFSSPNSLFTFSALFYFLEGYPFWNESAGLHCSLTSLGYGEGERPTGVSSLAPYPLGLRLAMTVLLSQKPQLLLGTVLAILFPTQA